MGGVEWAVWYMPLNSMFHACLIVGMVDTAHLKCVAPWRAGSSPASGTSDKTLYDVVEGLSVLREQSSACVLKSHSRPSYVPYRVWCGDLDTVTWCEHVTIAPSHATFVCHGEV